MKIVFMGTSDFATPSLDLLRRTEGDVVGIVTKPDRPKGRGRKMTASSVKELAECNGMTLFQPNNMMDESFILKLRELMPDVIVVVSFGQVIPREILNIPRGGCINLHPSLLPKYRGAAPVNWSIINGDRVTGVTTMFMDEGLDSGDILLQQEAIVEDDDTAKSLHARLAKTGASLLLETLRRLEEGNITAVPQEHSKATWAPMLKKEDGLIDWRKEGIQTSNLMRGLTPWPGAFTHLQGKILKLIKGIVLEGCSKGIVPGTVTEMDGEGIKVSTGRGFLLIKEVQLQDHKKMKVSDFLRGHKHRIGVGTILE